MFKFCKKREITNLEVHEIILEFLQSQSELVATETTLANLTPAELLSMLVNLEEKTITYYKNRIATPVS